MPDGDAMVDSSQPISEVGVVGAEESSSRAHDCVKDPRKIARKYQLELCKKAMEENIIVYLGTGCGKTHIAVLLIHELSHLIRKPQKSICVFLAPTVALVQQQARVIEDSTDLKVGIFCGGSTHLKNHHDWEKEIEKYEVLVMIPQILFRSLCHRFIKMELIALLIFDECHHAQVKSNHPYAQIMKEFYKPKEMKIPRIFGMTASPVVGKGASNQANLPKSINSLEYILDAKLVDCGAVRCTPSLARHIEAIVVYSVEDKLDLKRFVASPVVKVYPYGPVVNGSSSSYMIYVKKLSEIKGECLSTLSRERHDVQSLRNIKKQISRLHDNFMYCLENLGVWGARLVSSFSIKTDFLILIIYWCYTLIYWFSLLLFKASDSLLSGDPSVRNELIEAEGNSMDDSLYSFLSKAADVFASACTGDGIASELSCIEILKEPFFSEKLLRLIGILSSFRQQPNMKCIVFVNRIITARTLSYILQKLKFLAYWKCHFLVGVHAGLKSMSRKTMKSILEKFRCGELNLLIATKVGEEGLDIQTCCLVIRFDLPETVSSFIQSRGRARMPQSEYAFLVDSGNQREVELIKDFEKDENRMNMEISGRTSIESFSFSEERQYIVESSGASASAGYSISLLHQYCSKLPHDEFYNPKPKFYYFDDLGGTVCHIILPSNAPTHRIVGTPQSSIEAAKKDACLKAIEELHKLGALNDYLLPDGGNENEEDGELDSSDSDGCEGENEIPRGGRHEMLVPAILKESWAKSENPVYLNSYYFQFIPDPKDRIYKDFGLFVKSPLPQEAEKMELDLHLARGRTVKTEFVPSGVAEFTKDEIIQAQHFQEMFLKVILDRSKFISDYVSLGEEDYESNSSTFYLLLPVIFHENASTVTVDWKIVRTCLSSPVFREPPSSKGTNFFPSDEHLQLDNGCWSISDVENSLIYARHKDSFYFVSNVVWEKNGYSPYKDSGTTNHVEHLIKRYDINLKYPGQPLLHAKPLFRLHNLLHNRKPEDTESHELDEYFYDMPPELCQLKIRGFSKDIGSSVSLLPSIMHRLENLLVAIELKQVLSASFSEGAEISAHRVYIRDQPFDPCQFFALGHRCTKICSKETEKKIHSKKKGHAADDANSGEIRCSKGHHWLHKKTIADVVEALVGAFIVDSGFKAATAFLRWIGIQVKFESSQVTNACLASRSYLSLTPSLDMAALENFLGYQFLHKGLLLQAFLHPSYTQHGGGCYQRLEFLGDAVLDYLITSYLFSTYPKLKPGHLTDLRSVLVNNKAFANVAVDRSLHNFLMFDSNGLSEAINNYVKFIKTSSSSRNLIEGTKCPKALGDLVESCMGAILLDSGFNLSTVWKIMLSFLEPVMSFSGMQLNPIRELQEVCQYYDLHLQFPARKKGTTFLVEGKVTGRDLQLCIAASNPNKKAAIRIASQKLFTELKAKGYTPKSKPLEEFLKSSCKMEARLIGFDETPIDVVVPDDYGFESCGSNGDSDICSDSDVSDISSPSITPVNRWSSLAFKEVRRQPSETISDPSGDTDSEASGGSANKSARSHLYEICAANCWKPPLFECCEEEGPSHLKSFTFKVIVGSRRSSEYPFGVLGGT
ncbi:hypothetical protein Patl1_14811 [Pistacia atlantica]|uniref:Uncharacterized protein n=1 Tax=Pistacia atlantica TaxID=434234 RepID=A0ACC1ASS8_9ROSI|nr:hypothetical protein Patl1_14811 [Pistacia atlantica]